jgi:23S rRNA (adenine1618-N6)-methyltransferase
MKKTKIKHPKEKPGLHPRNKHRDRYNFKSLIHTNPDLKHFVLVNNWGDESIDFFNPKAVKELNKSLLLHFYKLSYWDIPEDYLCPPIPGRADYIHYMADLLLASNSVSEKKELKSNKIKCLDIGTGANCVYPIIGHQEYDWSIVGTEIDALAIENAKKIIDSNEALKEHVEIREQSNPPFIFEGVIKENEKFDLSICNPPFHSTLEEAQEANIKKVSNLKHQRVSSAAKNFGGVSNELWCFGGEAKFVTDMIRQSKQFADSVFWFSSLVSKVENLKNIYAALTKIGAVEVKTMAMSQGSKKSRIVAWTFLKPEEQAKWIAERWT